jgi:hypothetical protein
MGALWEERGEAAVGTGGACGALALPAPSVTWAERAVYPEQVGSFGLRPPAASLRSGIRELAASCARLRGLA